MADHEDWVVDDSAEMIAQMRAVLANPQRSVEEKLEALTLLANLADDEAINVLRWYREHADPGLELYAELALAEAEYLAAEPTTYDWEDELVDRVLEAADAAHELLGSRGAHSDYRRSLVSALRTMGVRVDEGARALVKYAGQVVEIASLDLVVEGAMLVGIWTSADEARYLEENEDGEHTPAELFYADLRTSNLPSGLLVDVSSAVVSWELLENLDVDRGRPKVEYILALSANVATE